MTSDVFYELCKDHLQTAIQSDYLQVIVSSYSIVLLSAESCFLTSGMEQKHADPKALTTGEKQKKQQNLA